ncbi:hypothetical protein NHX12_008003 [Muraenolepis orangiensis]|uniref:PID domain-containing protein n=1 Tax=Muraenolepis orangiensis TaxID=630683 RepID=A0A9Q0DKM6_9TELE|nr:hypothetical protein NHX12_008003 [Muraenolepis orangiensis]
MHVCEEAVKKLKDSGKKTVKAVLWVSADGLRVVDEKTKDLIVDQTIEKVSFCAPDRNFDKAFSYICRDGTTRRWICHCFMALKDSGERLSHAVGCAFAACLERKQRREKECGVTASFDASRTSFEKKKDPPRVVPAPPPGTASPPEGTASPLEPGGPHAIPRRHAPIEQLVRQGSFRGFPALSQKNSPFKRQLSLRLNDLPSTLQRRTDFQTPGVLEMDLGLSDEPDCSINALCSQINTSFTKPGSDQFFCPPPGSSNGLPGCAVAPPPPPAPGQATSSWVQADPPLHSPPAVSMAMQMHGGHRRTPSEAERWLEEVAKAVRAQQQTPPPPPHSSMAPPLGPPIPILPGPPTVTSQSCGPVSSISVSHGCVSNPLMSGHAPVSGPMPPPISMSSIPLIPGPPMSGPPMSLPSMSIPTMSGPSVSGAPMMQQSLPGPPGGQAFPSSAPVGSFSGQPVPPAYAPMRPYMPGPAGGVTYPGAGVPVVGITPSQMVANVFCGAVGPTGGFSSPAFPSCPPPPPPLTVNGMPPGHGAAQGLPNGNANCGVWPPEGSRLTAPASGSVSREADRFEAKWAALETKAAPGGKAPGAASTANPFSNDLQKTFEIEL